MIKAENTMHTKMMLTEVSTSESEVIATQDPKRRLFSATVKIAIYNELTREGEDNLYSYREGFRRRDAWASLAGSVKATTEVSAKTVSGITVILRSLRMQPPVSAATTPYLAALSC